jgi:mitogen-activated protein kinase kinase
MKDCSSPNIVTFYGAFLSDTGDVVMCMEYMDAGYVFGCRTERFS